LRVSGWPPNEPIISQALRRSCRTAAPRFADVQQPWRGQSCDDKKIPNEPTFLYLASSSAE
jgi:hypothetical protein